MKKLSGKREQILQFIRNFIDRQGYPPTVRDIMAGCGASSTSVVAYHLKILKDEGYISHRPEISRGLGVVGKAGIIRVPVIGVIAAGEPIPVPEAETWDSAAAADTMEVPRELTRGRENVFALMVKGTSMIDALINDGDIVLMQPVRSVDNGEMAAVWLKNEKEVTLKRYYADSGRVRLQPANSQMEPIYVRPGNVEIQGKVIAVIRKLS